MFGWLRKRIAQERRRLAYQNYKASTDPEMPFLCTVGGMPDAFGRYDAWRNFSQYFIEILSIDRKVDHEDVEMSLQINKELRHVFDEFGRKGRGLFDEVYRPLAGWPYYFETNSNEIHLVENYMKIQDVIARSDPGTSIFDL